MKHIVLLIIFVFISSKCFAMTAAERFLLVGASPPPNMGSTSLAITGMLLHMDGTNGGSTFTDSVASPKTVNATGATTSSSFYKFGTTSGYFGPATSTKYLSVPSDSSLIFGSNNRTISMWVYLLHNSGNTWQSFIISKGPTSSTAGWNIAIDNTGTSYHVGLCTTNNDTNIYASYAMSVNIWHHIEVDTVSGTTTLYIDGTSVGSTSVAWAESSDPLIVGNWNYIPSEYNFDGYIDEVYINNGTALHSSNFTPPTTPY